MYKCCRWCNNFSEGKCRSSIFNIELDTNIESIYDDGLIEEPLKESVEEINLDDFYDLAKELKNIKS